MSIRVELFISPGCTKCAHVKTMLKSVMDELGQDEFAWREVDLIEESAYAIGLGVSLSPSIVIDGHLVFSSAPKAGQLCAELTRRLVYELQATEPAENADVSPERRSCHGS
jgi:glutaredoxin